MPEEKNLRTFGICIADKNVEITCFYKQTVDMCKNYLAHFDIPDVCVKITKEDIITERENSKRITLPELGIYNNKVALTVDYSHIEPIIVYRKIVEALLEQNIILIHGAAIMVDKYCYIFTAPSGVGKTTHINNWKKCFPDTIVINGDKPLVNMIDKMVYGTPWCGKEAMNTNTSALLSGIIVLERGKTNCLYPISFSQMLPTLLQQCYIPKSLELYLKAYQLIGNFRNIPCYRLICNMEKEAAIVAFNALMEQR